jgi:hypothetical protein
VETKQIMGKSQGKKVNALKRKSLITGNNTPLSINIFSSLRN